jgi:hypothetical protein
MRVKADVIFCSCLKTTSFFWNFKNSFNPFHIIKLLFYISAGLMAIPLVNCAPLAVAGVEAVRNAEEDVPTIFGYVGYKEKRDAEEDVPTIFGYLGYKKE